MTKKKKKLPTRPEELPMQEQPRWNVYRLDQIMDERMRTGEIDHRDGNLRKQMARIRWGMIGGADWQPTPEEKEKFDNIYRHKFPRKPRALKKELKAQAKETEAWLKKTAREQKEQERISAEAERQRKKERKKEAKVLEEGIKTARREAERVRQEEVKGIMIRAIEEAERKKERPRPTPKTAEKKRTLVSFF